VQQSVQQSTQQLAKQSAQQPSDRNTLDRRLEFLTNQNRELYEQLTLLHARVRALDEKAAASDAAPPSNVAAPTNADAAAQALLVVHGTCQLATPQALDNKGRVGEKAEEVPAGTELALAYPMIEAEGGPAEGGAVLMRRMNVDVATAQVTWTWVTLYDAANGSYVGSFRPIA
jgi:hypothetical protein